ncbi:hypothetical protein U1Q18_010527 [Sarracenia purpurea var. burkii]
MRESGRVSLCNFPLLGRNQIRARESGSKERSERDGVRIHEKGKAKVGASGGFDGIRGVEAGETSNVGLHHWKGAVRKQVGTGRCSDHELDEAGSENRGRIKGDPRGMEGYGRGQQRRSTKQQWRATGNVRKIGPEDDNDGLYGGKRKRADNTYKMK